MLDANAVLGDRRRGLRRSIAATVAVVMALALLPSIGADAAPRGPGGPPTSPPAGSPPGGPADPPGLTDGFGIEVLSSAPDQVTGGDARIAIAVPRQVPPHQVRVLLNGEDVTEAFTIGGRRLEGVLSGMHLGENDLVVRANGQGRARPVGRLTLVNHPASGPVFSWSPGEPAPADIATASVLDGPDEVPFLVRQRARHQQPLHLLDRDAGRPGRARRAVWNDRLVFSLEGGVAIGRTQGNVSQSAQLLDHALEKGYAVVNSTGLRMNTHYNLQLGGETALMLKERFIVGYGVPRTRSVSAAPAAPSSSTSTRRTTPGCSTRSCRSTATPTW
jgi:hypothetical protein